MKKLGLQEILEMKAHSSAPTRIFNQMPYSAFREKFENLTWQIFATSKQIVEKFFNELDKSIFSNNPMILEIDGKNIFVNKLLQEWRKFINLHLRTLSINQEEKKLLFEIASEIIKWRNYWLFERLIFLPNYNIEKYKKEKLNDLQDCKVDKSFARIIDRKFGIDEIFLDLIKKRIYFYQFKNNLVWSEVRIIKFYAKKIEEFLNINAFYGHPLFTEGYKPYFRLIDFHEKSDWEPRQLCSIKLKIGV